VGPLLRRKHLFKQCIAPYFSNGVRRSIWVQLQSSSIIGPKLTNAASSPRPDHDTRCSCVQKVAPKHQVGTALVLQNRKAFATWLFPRLTSNAWGYLEGLEKTRPSQVPKLLWPIMHAFLQEYRPHEIEMSQRILDLANMTMPHTWYPMAAAMNRRVIYYAGPTNSGKTHTAIQVCLMFLWARLLCFSSLHTRACWCGAAGLEGLHTSQWTRKDETGGERG
jgi:hypothetical protein